jgi:hypothetical protein
MASTPRKNRRSTRSAGKVIPLNVESRVVRWDKVAAVQKRMAAGHYDRPEVRERMIDAVLRELRDR